MNETRCRHLLDAARADSVPPGEAGLWTISKHVPTPKYMGAIDRRALGRYHTQTSLRRVTLETQMTGGEVVMEDSEQELARHLPAMLHATGNCLVTGLGLGCVVRGMLANGNVRHIDVVESDPAIVRLVWPSFKPFYDRVTLWQYDARNLPLGRACWRWHFAWHDVWDEHEALDLVHMKLLLRYHDHARMQGAWQLDRTVKRLSPIYFVNAPLRTWRRHQQRRGRAWSA